MYQLSADVGGTFVDVVLVDLENRQITVNKVPSTKTSAEGILNGIGKSLDAVDAAPADVGRFVHGFTIATNAWLTQTGAEVSLVVTKGFRDLLEIGSQRRPGLYILANPRKQVLVPRSGVIEVGERIAADGSVDQPLERLEIDRIVSDIEAASPESVAISLLFSYLNPAHELALRDAITKRMPELPVYLSSETNPQIQEYVRTNTTVAGAYVGPPTGTYIASLTEGLAGNGFICPILLMRSDGGVATPKAAVNDPVTMLLSGPAGGVIGAAELGKVSGVENLVTFDMGGTSADFSLIYKGKPKTVTERFMNGQPLRTSMLDIETISAGGGSIGFVDPGGALRIGPESAGSIPGPACYGRGGEQATLTDATVWLGLVDPDDFAGGDLKLDRALAGEAIKRNVAGPLGTTVEEAAWGMISVACAQMRQAIRTLSVERGHDIREFSLLAFGGAGSIFATLMQNELGLKSVLIPPRPGVFAALGLLLADIKHNVQRPYSNILDAISEDDAKSVYHEMWQQLSKRLDADGVAESQRLYAYSLDARYVGQFHDISILVGTSLEGDWWSPEQIKRTFDETHAQLYGHADEQSALEIVGLRATATGLLDKPHFPKLDRTMDPKSVTPQGKRDVVLEANGTKRECIVFKRSELLSGHEITGPAIISQSDTTVFIFGGQVGTVDDFGNIHVTEQEEGE